MVIQCPHCQSHNTVRVDPGKTQGGIAGSAAGLIAGAVQAASAARIIGPIHVISGPVGMASITILGAAAGGLAGYLAGQRIAHDIKDLRSLRYQCLDCGRSF